MTKKPNFKNITIDMENTEITRPFLETLSFSDLVKVADEYGIDVPEDLNRSFLIGEILEVVADMENSMNQQEMIISDDEFVTDEKEIEELDEAAALQDVSHMPARVKCAVLGWKTMQEILEHPEKSEN